MLQSALEGERGTDQELAGSLGVSLPTIKKMWLSLYRRVADTQAEIIPASVRPETGTSERGKEKRRHLLAYLQETAGNPVSLIINRNGATIPINLTPILGDAGDGILRKRHGELHLL